MRAGMSRPVAGCNRNRRLCEGSVPKEKLDEFPMWRGLTLVNLEAGLKSVHHFICKPRK